MAFVHHQSCECAKSELDIFSVPGTQTSIESGGWAEYNPISSLSDSVPIEFAISGSGNDYMDLANSHIFVRAKITQADGTNIDNTHHVAPVNLLLHSLFSEVDLKINDTLVSSTNNTYAYRSYIETLLTYGYGAKKSQLGASMYIKDVAGFMDNNNPHDAAHLNQGMKDRHAFFEDSHTVDMIGCLHSDLFFQDKYLPSDVNLRIRLVRNKDAFCLMSAAAATYKIKIVECKLLIRKAKLSPSVYVAHAKALEIGNAKYPIRRALVKTFTVSRGSLNYNQENLFSGQIPSRIVVGLVENEAFNGSYTKNPFNFKHMNLSQLKVYLDGQQQPIRPLEPNFGNGQYIESYMSLFVGTGKYMKDESIDITRADFPAGYALYAYDLTPDLADEGGHFNLQREGSVRLDLKFTQGLPTTINVVVYAEFQNIIELNRNREVIFDYSS